MEKVNIYSLNESINKETSLIQEKYNKLNEKYNLNLSVNFSEITEQEIKTFLIK